MPNVSWTHIAWTNVTVTVVTCSIFSYLTTDPSRKFYVIHEKFCPELQYVARLESRLGISALIEILHGNNHPTSNSPSHTDKKNLRPGIFFTYIFVFKVKVFLDQNSF